MKSDVILTSDFSLLVCEEWQKKTWSLRWVSVMRVSPNVRSWSDYTAVMTINLQRFYGSMGIPVIDQHIWRWGISRIVNPTYIWRRIKANPGEPIISDQLALFSVV